MELCKFGPFIIAMIPNDIVTLLAASLIKGHYAFKLRRNSLQTMVTSGEVTCFFDAFPTQGFGGNTAFGNKFNLTFF